MIYVDDHRGKFRGMVMCHMMSDSSLQELHRFAHLVGLRRSWFQEGSAPHYDLSLTKRKQALRMGAVHLPIRLHDGRPNPAWRDVLRRAKELKR